MSMITLFSDWLLDSGNILNNIMDIKLFLRAGFEPLSAYNISFTQLQFIEIIKNTIFFFSERY